MNDFIIRHRRWIEIGFWPVLFFSQDLVGAASVNSEYARLGIPLEAWKPYVWELTSGVAILIVLPAVIWLDRRLDWSRGNWHVRVAQHLPASVAFSVAHVVLMVGLRHLAYLPAGDSYDFGNWGQELWYEYRKDFITYWTILAIVHAYRAALGRAAHRTSGPPAPGRLISRKRGREYPVSLDDVEWVEAAGNYVNLHTEQGIYPVRETMSSLEAMLDEHFMRVHRSVIVRLGDIVEIEPRPSGEAKLTLRSGAEVMVSRRYRDDLRRRLAPG